MISLFARCAGRAPVNTSPFCPKLIHKLESSSLCTNPIASDLAERILDTFPVKSKVLREPDAFSDNAESLTCPQRIILSAALATKSIIASIACLQKEYVYPNNFQSWTDYIFYSYLNS